MSECDMIDEVAGLASDSPVRRLRRERDAFVRHSQGSYDVLLAPAEPGGVSLLERAAIALHVARLEGDMAWIEHHEERLARLDGPQDRLGPILDHVTMIATQPAAVTHRHLEPLRAQGLAPRDIVVITQIVAFVSYQVRLTAGLRALARECGQ